MKGAAISALCSLVCAGALFGQQAEISVAEQQDLMRALSDGNTSPPDLIRALEALERNETVTLSELKLEGGSQWRLSMAPPRRP